MRLLPLLLLLIPAAAIAQDAPPRLMGNGAPPAVLSGGLPPLPQAPRAVIGRLFISPAGEPFRAPVDATYPLATWFAGADHNHDGKIDLTEMTWDFDRFFDSIDTDHDGTLRNDEIERYERMVPELHSGFAGGGGFGGGGGRGKGGGGHHRGGGGGGRGGGGMGGGMGGTGGGFGGGGGAGGYHGDDADAGSGAAQGGQDEQSSEENHAPPAYVPTGSATRYELISIPEPVSAMDTDLSGTVTRLELHRAAARRFAILDVKQRGFLMLTDLPEPDAERHINPQRNRR
ncbi:MAG: EF-hand protein [Sphingomonas bacterium]|nr:EF-hand protein [Sphingomonas bacterium]